MLGLITAEQVQRQRFGALADLLKGSVETPGARSDVEQISRAVRDAAALMKRVQMLARKRAHTISVIRVQDVVDGAVDLVSTQARHQGVTLEVQAPADPILTRGDPYLLQQAVLNIAVNAIQAMPGGGTLEISTASGAAGGVAITFHDTGPGMDPAVAEHIFDPFFTTKPEGEGTGLGLPLALHVVELHGGAIDVGSTEGRGATFRILLPRNPGEPEHDGGEA